jgi:hypothetical protein
VFISLTNQYQTFIDQAGMTQSIAFIQTKSLEEAQRIEQELNNKLYYFLNNIARFGNFNNIRVLQNFPVYSQVNLTQKERDLINIFYNQYYKKTNKKREDNNENKQ